MDDAYEELDSLTKQVQDNGRLTQDQYNKKLEEAVVDEIKHRFHQGEQDTSQFADEDDLIDAKEDMYLGKLTSRLMALNLKEDKYNEYELDKLFGVSYDNLELPEFD